MDIEPSGGLGGCGAPLLEGLFGVDGPKRGVEDPWTRFWNQHARCTGEKMVACSRCAGGHNGTVCGEGHREDGKSRGSKGVMTEREDDPAAVA